ncbi:GNAT family N-acetyltransferase [Photobacterium lutimaris]|uniref:N-acetyltransferase n=1 Tax=Photobacterium lutimaris TaxID=388278 RepID=A0A2T3J4U9_9GAMM|nr:GNAT family N-acetyltransferase [Photobacterium lutimaris]PSU36318.1 N-acetyltransferase [Photobacterium lutimaris]TDR74792.1 acetyltransferase (GNAT) family protein [Photobacterium lutimaris]
MDLSLRNANESDMRFLLDLRDKTMKHYLEEAGLPTSNEEYEKRIRFEFDSAQIVEWGRSPIGLFKVTYSHKRNYWYIVQIQIDPEYQGMKIGSWLINSNPAKHLYFCLGIREVSAIDAEQRMDLKPQY